MDNNFNMTFEESQDYIAKRGFYIPWNDCDVFINEREINRTIGNVLKWADKTMIEKACEWLQNTLYEVSTGLIKCPDVVSIKSTTMGDFINNFRKAMEE